MQPISYCRHRFPPEIIHHAVGLSLRFTLSCRDVEDLLAERGLEISYETIRCPQPAPATTQTQRPVALG
jgi:putative transposase